MKPLSGVHLKGGDVFKSLKRLYDLLTIATKEQISILSRDKVRGLPTNTACAFEAQLSCVLGVCLCACTRARAHASVLQVHTDLCLEVQIQHHSFELFYSSAPYHLHRQRDKVDITLDGKRMHESAAELTRNVSSLIVAVVNATSQSAAGTL